MGRLPKLKKIEVSSYDESAGTKSHQPKEEEEIKEEEIIKEVSSYDESVETRSHQTKPVFNEEEEEKPNIEMVIEPIEKTEPIDIPQKEEKKKRTRTMSEEAKKSLALARAKSLETRRNNALKRKEEEKKKYNNEYEEKIRLIEEENNKLKNEMNSLKDKIVANTNVNNNNNNNYKFSIDDMDYYAQQYHKKIVEARDNKRKEKISNVRNQYLYNMR